MVRVSKNSEGSKWYEDPAELNGRVQFYHPEICQPCCATRSLLRCKSSSMTVKFSRKVDSKVYSFADFKISFQGASKVGQNGSPFKVTPFLTIDFNGELNGAKRPAI